MTERTTNYSLAKPGENDTLNVEQLNADMDTVDNELNKLSGSLAIVQHTDIATRDITEGQFVCWKGSLYKASTDIAEGDTLSLGNLTACTGGGLNEYTKKWNTLFAFIGVAWLDPGKSMEMHPSNFINSQMRDHNCTEFGGIVGYRILNDNNVISSGLVLATITREACVVKNLSSSELSGDVVIYFLAR